MITLTRSGCIAAGATVLATLAIEAGGGRVLALTTGADKGTELQLTYSRTGHGHAGALATLGLVGIVLTDAAGVRGVPGHISRWAIPASAVLMPAGFFASVAHRDADEPNSAFVLVPIGAAVLAAGLGTLGVSLLRSSRSRA